MTAAWISAPCRRRRSRAHRADRARPRWRCACPKKKCPSSSASCNWRRRRRILPARASDSCVSSATKRSAEASEASDSNRASRRRPCPQPLGRPPHLLADAMVSARRRAADVVDRRPAIGGGDPVGRHRAVERAGNVGEDDRLQPESLDQLAQPLDVGDGQMRAGQDVDPLADALRGPAPDEIVNQRRTALLQPSSIAPSKSGVCASTISVPAARRRGAP